MSVTLLLSGGLDSVFILHARKPKVTHAVFVDYGQPAAGMELRASRVHCKEAGIPFNPRALRLPCLELYETTENPRVVPGRNLALISLAVALAAHWGDECVLFGANADDVGYPDCSPAFVESVDALAFTTYGVHVIAPLIDKTKAEIIELARGISILPGETWSCLEGGSLPCGRCVSCYQIKEVS